MSDEMVRNKMHVQSPSMKNSPYLQDKCSAHLPLTFPRPLLRIQIARIPHWDDCQWPIMRPVFQFFLATIGSLNSTISKESAQVVLEPVVLCGGVWRYPPGGDTNKGLVGLTLANSADRNCGAENSRSSPQPPTSFLDNNPFHQYSWKKVFDFNTVCVQL